MTGGIGRSWSVLVLLCVVQLMLILDVSVVNLALPQMQRELGFTPAGLQWVISGYALTFGGLLVLGGRCGDLFGRKRLFGIGLVVFVLASALGGFAVSAPMLVLGRLVQGAGAALVAPAALSLLTTHFSDGDARNRALGVWGAASAAGGAVGILVGGPLAAVSWRAVLLINLPIGAAALVAATRLLRETTDRAAPRLDLPGAVLITAAIGAVVYGLGEAAALGPTSPAVLAAVAAGLVLLVVFLVVQRHVAHPLVPPHVLRVPGVALGNAIIVCVLAVATATAYFLSLYLQQVLGYSTLLTGMAFLPNAVLVGIVATSAGRFVPRIGVRRLMIVSLLLLAAGGLLLARITPDSGYLVVLPGLLLNAAGLGGAFVTVSIVVTADVPADDQGIASGLFNTAQQVGVAVGLAVLVAVADAGTGLSPGPAQVVDGYRAAFLGTAAAGAVALLLALLVGRHHQQRTVPAPAPGMRA